MEELVAGMIQFNGYRLVNVRYDCEPEFEFDNIKNGDMKFGFSKKSVVINENTRQLNLAGHVFFSDGEDFDKAPYKVVVEIAGMFSSQTEFMNCWENNALAILFPYVRSIISSITAQSGRPAVILPTANIVKMFSEAEKND